MAWSGGTFTRTNGVNSGATTWATDAAAGVKIVDTRHDTHDQDLATGINQCLNKDGSNYADAINVGHATDTTITRSSAGLLAVEGITVPTVHQQTLTLDNTFTSGAAILVSFNTGSGKFVNIIIKDQAGHTNSSSPVTTALIPAAYRPATVVHASSGVPSSNIQNMIVAADGTIRVTYEASRTAMFAGISVSYYV